MRLTEREARPPQGTVNGGSHGAPCVRAWCPLLGLTSCAHARYALDRSSVGRLVRRAARASREGQAHRLARCWALPFEPRRLSRASAAERWPSRACRAGARVLSCDRTTPSLATKHAMTATAFSETALGCPASERTSAVAAGVQHRAGCWRASRGHRVRVLIGCTRARPASAAIGACLRPTGWTGEALAMRRASRPRRSLVRRMFRPNLRDGRREGGGARKGHR